MVHRQTDQPSEAHRSVPTRRRRRRAARPLVLIAVVAMLAPTSGHTLAGPSSISSPPAVELGGAAWSTVYGFGGAWVQVDPPVDQLVKVDAETGTITVTVDGGTGAATAADAVWVTVGGRETRKLDPETGESLLTVSTPNAYYVSVGAGAVWVPADGGIARIDADTGQIVTTIPIDGRVTDLLATDDAVWVTDKSAGRVIRVDPATNTVVAEIDTGAGAHDLAIDDHGGVWATNYRANTVSHIEPVTNHVVATIEGVGSGVGISAGGGAIWVSEKGQGVSRIDPVTHEVTLVAELAGWSYGVAYGDDELWVSNVDQELVYRLDLHDWAGAASTPIDIALPYQAGSVAAAAGSIWVIPHLNEVVLRIDPATDRVVEEIALPGVVGAEIDANDEAVWISVSTPGSYAPAGVVRLDPATGAITGPFVVEGVDEIFPRIATDGVWVGGAGRFARLDAASGDVLQVVDVAGNGHVPTTAGLWIAHERGIWSIDPSTGTVDEIGQAVAGMPEGQFGAPYLPVAEDQGLVWGVGAGSVVALDVNLHDVAMTVDLPDELSPCPDGAISESVFWLITGSGGCWGNATVLIGIDTTTGAVIREQPLEFSPEFGMDVTSDAVWVPVVRKERIVRIPIESSG